MCDGAYETTVGFDQYRHDVHAHRRKTQLGKPFQPALLHVAKVHGVVDMLIRIHVAPAHGHVHLVHHDIGDRRDIGQLTRRMFRVFHRQIRPVSALLREFKRGGTNYNRLMQSHVIDPPPSTMITQRCAFLLQPQASVFPPLEYCLTLAHKNMSPYLERRGEQFSDERWREHSPRAEFFLIVDYADTPIKTVGFVGLRNEPDAPEALHVGDVQVEPRHQNRGAGWAALRHIETLALSRGLTALTLNVFRDNPAIFLYQRFGFQSVNTQFYRHKMRKILVA